MICAREIAWNAAKRIDGLVAPEVGYSPAPFNMSFPGTISISTTTYEALMREVIEGLMSHGFQKIYILNGHGANLDPLAEAASRLTAARVRVKSWWEFEPVNLLRKNLYGEWEGMHATPSEIAITQVNHRVLDSALAAEPPEKLTPAFIKAHGGDKHGPAQEHRAAFPDGRVGSHSALARADHGVALKKAAVAAVAADYLDFIGP